MLLHSVCAAYRAILKAARPTTWSYARARPFEAEELPSAALPYFV